MNFFIYSLPIVTFAFTSQMPANLTIYWFINNYITVFVFFMLKIPKIKNLFGFPELSKETQQLEIKFNVNEGKFYFECFFYSIILIYGLCFLKFINLVFDFFSLNFISFNSQKFYKFRTLDFL